MERPTITNSQRELAVTLLANAIRKRDALQRRVDANPSGPGLLSSGSRSRLDAARRYVDGMSDLLAVLFLEGRPLADDCCRAAQRLAGGGAIELNVTDD